MELVQSFFSSLSDPQFFASLMSIILIDIVLAGDNSVVIAMAVQALPPKQRVKGILFGSMVAVVLRIIFTFFASKMLLMPLIKLIGGALILWIAVKLMDHTKEETKSHSDAQTLWKAIWIILVADVTMSLDNILAVAGASHGNLSLLLFGFGLSIPLVVFTSSLISKLMQRFPLIMWIGAAILGKVGGEMMITDPFIVTKVLTPLNLTVLKNTTPHANHYLIWSCELIATIGVICIALWLRKSKKGEKQAVHTVV